MAPPKKPVLLIGATGMLGRPLARRLARDRVPIRIMARNLERARTLFPSGAEFVRGKLESIEELSRALEGCRAVYVSVDTLPQSKFKPETEGLKNVVTAAKEQGTPRLLVLSAYGSGGEGTASHPWWHVREKYEAQRIAKTSGLPWTIFEPTWFSESLPLFVKGKTFSLLKGATLKPHWVSGDDYGRIVSAALQWESTIEKTIPVQGPEALTLEEAGRRFIQAYDRAIQMKTVPMWILRLAGVFSAQAKEFVTLLKVCGELKETPPDPSAFPELPMPSMTIEAYAGYCRATGDFPQK